MEEGLFFFSFPPSPLLCILLLFLLLFLSLSALEQVCLLAPGIMTPSNSFPLIGNNVEKEGEER